MALNALSATLIAFGLYFAVSLFVFGRGLWGHFFTRFMSGGTDHDPSWMMWTLVWWPYALAHHLDVFLCKIVWWPSGVNLAWVTSAPLMGLAAWPITRALGPVGSFNVLCMVAPPLAGLSAFLLLRHLTDRFGPSLLGGYIFGFSPFILGRMLGQLFMMFVFPIPLAVLLVVLLVEERLSPTWFVVLMTPVLFMLFGISLEIYATTAIFGATALAIGYAVGSDSWKRGVRRTLTPLGISYAVALVPMASYLYHLFAFGFPHGSIVSPKAYSCDLLNFLLPTPTNLLGANSLLASISSRFPHRPEADAYIALPFAAITVSYARSRWDAKVGKLLTIFLGVVLVCSIGPRLHVAGMMLFGMPWGLFDHLPLIRSALPGRFMVYAFLALAVIAALWMSDDTHSPLLRGAAALAILAFMLPNLRPGFWTMPVDTPAFFSQGLYRKYLGKDETIIILPYGQHGNTMLWQAQTGMYFRMAEGHTGPTVINDFQRWPIVNVFYFRRAIPDPATQLKAFLAVHRVGAIVVAHTRGDRWWKPVLATLGVKPIEVGGVLFYRIPPDELAPYRNAKAIDYELAFNRARFQTLLVGAKRYVSQGEKLSDLTPFHAEQRGFLPINWALGHSVYDRNGLWLGPVGNGKVGVGIVASYEAVKPIIREYGPLALRVYFPYPRLLNGRPKGDPFMRKLVMVFDRAGLARAAARATAHAKALSNAPAGPDGSLPTRY